MTVALVCHNEKERLALVLNDIKSQTFFSQIKEVILFQTGSCQKTRAAAESFKERLPLVFLSSIQNNLGLARAQIVKKAQSDWIAFTDSDCRLKENWLETLVHNAKILMSAKDNHAESNIPGGAFFQNKKNLISVKDKKAAENIGGEALLQNKTAPRVKKTLYGASYIPKKSALTAQGIPSRLSNRQPYLKPYKLAAVGGPNRLPEDKFWKKMLNLSLNFPVGHAFSAQAWKPKKARLVSHIPTTNGLFFKSAVLSAGSFSKKLSSVGEDLELGIRLSRQGALFLCPQPVVINNYASSYLESLKRLLLFGSIQIQKKGLIFYLALLFLPLFAASFLAVFIALFLPVFVENPLFSWISKAGGFFLFFYFLLLFFYGLVAFIKKKKSFAVLLIFFWFLQHSSYSLGVNMAFLKSLRFYKNKLTKKKC